MLKRLFPLALVIVTLFVATPSVQAAPCFRCEFRVVQQCHVCTQAQLGQRYDGCDIFDCECVLGDLCATAAAEKSTPSLASEYAVASVERLDEARPSPALVALAK